MSKSYKPIPALSVIDRLETEPGKLLENRINFWRTQSGKTYLKRWFYKQPNGEFKVTDDAFGEFAGGPEVFNMDNHLLANGPFSQVYEVVNS